MEAQAPLVYWVWFSNFCDVRFAKGNVTEYPLGQISITRSCYIPHLPNVCSVRVLYPSNFIMQPVKFFLHTYLSGSMPYSHTFFTEKRKYPCFHGFFMIMASPSLDNLLHLHSGTPDNGKFSKRCGLHHRIWSVNGGFIRYLQWDDGPSESINTWIYSHLDGTHWSYLLSWITQ